MEIMDKDSVSKMGAHALAENTPNTTPNFIRLFGMVWEIVAKKALSGVRLP